MVVVKLFTDEIFKNRVWKVGVVNSNSLIVGTLHVDGEFYRVVFANGIAICDHILAEREDGAVYAAALPIAGFGYVKIAR